MIPKLNATIPNPISAIVLVPVLTKELIDGYYTRLLAERRTTSAGDTTALDFYLRHYAEVFRPLLELMAAGVRVDSAQRARRYDELVGRVSELKTQIVGA